MSQKVHLFVSISADSKRSVVWEKVFRELWKDRAARDHVAQDLNVPLEEIDGLIFNIPEDAQGVSDRRDTTASSGLRLA